METTRKIPQRRSPLREVVAFVAVTYSMTLALALAMPDADLNVPLTALLPSIAVTILTFTMFRRGSRRELWRGIGLGRTGARSWGAAFGVPILLCGGAFGIALLVGAGHLRSLNIAGFTTGDFVVDTLLNFVVMLLVLMGEEIGWRGFMLPRVAELTTRRRAALVTGFIHGCFHLPLIVICTTYDVEGSRWIAAPVAVATITAAGVFYAWLRDRSGSIWPVGLAHTFANTTFAWGFRAMVTTTPASLAYVAGEAGAAPSAWPWSWPSSFSVGEGVAATRVRPADGSASGGRGHRLTCLDQAAGRRSSERRPGGLLGPCSPFDAAPARPATLGHQLLEALDQRVWSAANASRSATNVSSPISSFCRSSSPRSADSSAISAIRSATPLSRSSSMPTATSSSSSWYSFTVLGSSS